MALEALHEVEVGARVILEELIMVVLGMYSSLHTVPVRILYRTAYREIPLHGLPHGQALRAGRLSEEFGEQLPLAVALECASGAS